MRRSVDSGTLFEEGRKWQILFGSRYGYKAEYRCGLLELRARRGCVLSTWARVLGALCTGSKSSVFKDFAFWLPFVPAATEGHTSGTKHVSNSHAVRGKSTQALGSELCIFVLQRVLQVLLEMDLEALGPLEET